MAQRVLAGVLLSLFIAAAARGATITAASCGQADVQRAVNSAANGDTVLVPAGSATWTASVELGSKAITLQGGGAGATKITHNVAGAQVHLLHFSQQTGAAARITGFAFLNGSYDHRMIQVDGSSTSAPYRIDHNDFECASPPAIFLDLGGNGPGLIDHNSFNAADNSEMIHNTGMGPDDASGWSNDVTPGSWNAVYLEDNAFTNTNTSPYFYGDSAIQSYFGARTVFRHNALDFVQVDQHGTAGMIGARWWEIYENTFNIPARATSGGQDKYMDLRAGSGVVFNNHKTGTASSAGIILREEDSGYPALYQVGRGINQRYSPAYVWGNDASMPVSSGSSNVVSGRDFFLSASQPASLLRQELSTDTAATAYAYVPFTYPYPLDANGLPNPAGSGGSAPTIASFTATPAAITAGQSSTLAWTVSNATSLRIDPQPGVVTGKTSVSTTPAATTTFTLTASNSSGTVTRTVTVSVNHPPAITSAATATPNPAQAGQAVAFAVAASDADNDALAYAWNFGDGASGSGAASSHTYAAAGVFTATVSVSDGHGGSATSSVTVTVNAVSSPATRINSGGAASGSFTADNNFTGGHTYRTTAAISVSNAANPAPQSVYQTERYGNFTYSVGGLAAGAAYTVRLHFAEIYWSSVGKRSFNVAINGQQVLANFDIYAVAGGKFKAIVREFPAAADANGQIAIVYSTIKDNAKSSGIEVIPAGGAAALALDAAAAPAASAPIDLGSVRVKQAFKLQLELPEAGALAKKLRWTVAPGTKLPDGLRVHGSVLGGRPKTAGTVTFELQLKAPDGATNRNAYSITVTE